MPTTRACCARAAKETTRSTAPATRMSAPWNDARRKAVAVVGDLAGLAPPHSRALGVCDAVLERPADHTQPERLAKHVGVDRHVHHQRIALALLDHLVELLDDHVAEIARVLLAVDHDLRVVDRKSVV